MKETKKIIFIGTSEFASIILSDLSLSISFQALITQPDRAQGRKRTLTPPPAKITAMDLGVKVLQPERICSKDFEQILTEMKPDLMILAAYGQIISQRIIDIPKFGIINVHPSLLPLYRGATPLQSAIKNSENITGVTLMQMDAQMDHGPIILQEKTEISCDETFKTLQEKTAHQAVLMINKILAQWFNQKIKPKPQQHAKATLTKTLVKEDGIIDWSKTAAKIDSQVRAFSTWPQTYTFLEKKGRKIKVKILEVKITDQSSEKDPGTIIKIGKSIGIQTKDKVLAINKLQVEGKKIITGVEFLLGYSWTVNTQLTR